MFRVVILTKFFHIGLTNDSRILPRRSPS